MPALLYPRAAVPGTAAYAAETKTFSILSFTGIFGLLALVAVVLRTYVRGSMLKCYGADDAVMGSAMLAGIAAYVCFLGESQYGLGHHLSTISEHDLITYNKYIFAHSLINVIGNALVKVSCSLLLLRLATLTVYKRFLWAFIVAVVAYNVFCLGTLIFSCIPVAASWNPALMARAKCWSLRTYGNLGVLNSAVGMFTDVLLAVIPIPVIIKLQVDLRTRIALVLILGLGFIACGCGAVKVYYQTTFLQDTDRTFHDRFFVWAALELYVSILAASLPTLKPLLAAFFQSARTAISRSQNASSNQQSSGRREKSGALSSFYRKRMDTLNSRTSSRGVQLSELYTPSPYEKSNEDYFGCPTARRPSYDVKTTCSRSASVPMGRLSADNGLSIPGMDDAILRTTKVVTVTETRERSGTGLSYLQPSGVWSSIGPNTANSDGRTTPCTFPSGRSSPFLVEDGMIPSRTKSSGTRRTSMDESIHPKQTTPNGSVANLVAKTTSAES